MRVTMTNIAVMANVSQAAVSIAINNKQSSRVSEAKRAEILALVEKLGYSPNVSARNLKGKGTNTIGIIGGFAGVATQSSLIWRITTLLRERGYHSLMVNSLTDKREESQVINEFIAHGVDAILISSLSDMTMDLPVPHLRVDTGEESCDIGIDKNYGGYAIAKHLIEEHGHENIAYITFTDYQTPRYEGHLIALAESGRSRPAEELFISTRNNINAEKQILDLINDGKATAFCCSNDFIAAQLIAFLRRNSVNVPGDVAVTGFDGLTLTEFVSPAITTVIQPMFELADKSVEMLMRKMEGNCTASETELLKPELHIAESCGCVKESPFMPFADFRSLETLEGCAKYSEEERMSDTGVGEFARP